MDLLKTIQINLSKADIEQAITKHRPVKVTDGQTYAAVKIKRPL